MDNESFENLLATLADGELKKFRDGSSQWSEFLFLPSWTVKDLADNLSHTLRYIGDDPEEIKDWKNNWAPDLDDALFQALLDEKIQPDRNILGHIDPDFAGEDITVYVEVPLKDEYSLLGWAIIVQSGPGLQPEYNLVQIFHTKAELEEWWVKNFM